jgi:hypothetical protein
MDAGTPYQHRQVIRVLLCFLPLQVNDKKYFQSLKWGSIPKYPSQSAMNLVGIHML